MAGCRTMTFLVNLRTTCKSRHPLFILRLNLKCSGSKQSLYMVNLFLCSLLGRHIIRFIPCNLVKLLLGLLAGCTYLLQSTFQLFVFCLGIISPNLTSSPLILARVSDTIVFSCIMVILLLTAKISSTAACFPLRILRPAQKTALP